LILAKILLPKDFGLIGMSIVFIVVIEALSELGMSAALIQKKDDSEVEKMYDTVFCTSVLWGVILYLVISFILAPIVSFFYEEPILTKVIPFLSLGILIKPLTTIHQVVLTRKLDFKKISKILNKSVFIAGITSIILALLDFGIWSLVTNYVLNILITVPLFFLSTRYRPTFSWNRDYFKEIFNFGVYSTSTSVFSTLTYNIDNLIIGKVLGANLLGAYSLSFSLTENLRQMISNVLNKVMYPVFGQNQDDILRLKDYFLSIVRINAIIIYPLMTCLFIFADQIIIIFGDKWTPSIYPLRILSLAVMVHLIVNSFTSLLRGLGKPKTEMKIIILTTLLVLLPSLFIGISNYGLKGASYAILINKLVLVITGLFILNKEINLSIIEIYNSIYKVVFSVVVSGIIVFFIGKMGFTNFFLRFSLYFILYVVIIYLLEKKEIKVLIDKIK